MSLYLIKVGELTLKKGNKGRFEKQLRDNIKKGFTKEEIKVWGREGRFYAECPEALDNKVERRLGHVFGIVGFSRVSIAPGKLPEEVGPVVLSKAREVMESSTPKSFRIQTRRVDKSLSLDSVGYNQILGGVVLDEYPDLEVNLNHPDFTIHVEQREKAYVYSQVSPGPGGLPVGSAGRGLLLLSGGIDSPVAGWMMAKRGLSLEAVTFHTPPYTSPDSLDKVRRLARMLAEWIPGMALHVVDFTPVQMVINKKGMEKTRTLHARAAMMIMADKIAAESDMRALVTGEALSQVASQTLHSLRYTPHGTTYPVLRPLVGLDKEEIIQKARKIGTFETSIEPHVDCCSLFSPDHPETKPDYDYYTRDFRALSLEELMEEGVKNRSVEFFEPKIIENDK